MKIFMIFRRGHLLPADDQAQELLESLKNGSMYEVTITAKRNIKFHRKYFALLHTAYEWWDGPSEERNGVTYRCSFDTFRDTVTIMSGHYEIYVTWKGELRKKAKSISFANMDEVEFEALYSRTIDVLLEHFLANCSSNDIENRVNQLLAFDG